MRIRPKIILLVLPILVATVVLVGVSSYFSAAAGINRITGSFLDFKAAELHKYADGQYQILVESNLTGDPAYVQATKGSIDLFASSLRQSDSEVVFALAPDGSLISATAPLQLRPGEGKALAALLKAKPGAMVAPVLAGVPRVAEGFWFEPYGRYYVVSETAASFYGDANAIGLQTIAILAAALAVATTLLVLFAGSLTRPLVSVTRTMEEVITKDDLDTRVVAEYDDETGKLAHSFNIMTDALAKNRQAIINFAMDAALAKNREHRIRTIFQKYVPQEVINQLEAAPETSLVGEDRVLSILFSDIRSFTTISEAMNPYDLVQNLNRYFSTMVDIILKHGGTVDKYIGDAIMAFWGAPIKGDDDAYNSVLAALEMNEALEAFNREQQAAGRPLFRIGIGLNYGVVTVGNMGSEKKLNYTIIGDNVNLGSRMEGLTKKYHQTILVSESIVYKVKDRLPLRFLDMVAVKGKKEGKRIYTVARELDAERRAGWDLHNQAMEAYLRRDFAGAIELLDQAERHLPGDYCVELIRGDCRALLADPPGPDWDGVRVMDEK